MQTIPLKLWQIAAVGFLASVIMHACVFAAVLGDGDAAPAAGSPARPASQPAARPPLTPTRLADRTSCDAVRGTEYRSESERLWFLQNCG